MLSTVPGVLINAITWSLGLVVFDPDWFPLVIATSPQLPALPHLNETITTD